MLKMMEPFLYSQKTQINNSETRLNSHFQSSARQHCLKRSSAGAQHIH